MPTIDFADAGLAIVFDGSLLSIVLREPLTLERARMLYKASQRTFDLYKGKACSLTIIEPSAAANQTPEVRQVTTALSKEFSLLGSAVVIEGSGFAVATIRTVIAGVYLLSKKPYPAKIFPSVSEGASFLSPFLSRPAAEIAAIGETTRRALRA
jgi:hypothetical protein